MVCKIVKTDKVTAFVCSRGFGNNTCDSCGAPSSLLCDFELKNASRATCDGKLCKSCTTKIEDKDYCPAHIRFLKSKS